VLRAPRLLTAPLLALAAAAVVGCGSAGPAPGADGRLQVVAAENFWGSLAGQLGGARADVRSIVANPDTDPHSYEPSAQDARTLASSQLAIVNGIGYDGWASRVLAASPASSRRVLDVGKLIGLASGANPHQWYSPTVVARVIDAIATDYESLDPAHVAYFRARRAALLSGPIARNRALIAQIARRYAGAPVGASESIFAPMAGALRLRLLTPAAFTRAIAEGTDPSAQDKATADRQIIGRQIVVWIFNRQNVTPDVQRLTSEARAAHIPVVTVTETLSPASASFQDWQIGELRSLQAALATATHR
jgi:zinc/manganese transport system substrate-binding protein